MNGFLEWKVDRKMEDKPKFKMPKINQSKPTIFRVVALSLAVLLLLPCLGLCGGIGFFALEGTGTFSAWISLRTPPDKPIKFLASDIGTVYVATQGGRIYGCQHRGRQARCWFSVDQLPELDSHIYQNASVPVFEGQVPSPPGVVVSQLQVTRWEADFAEETRYAVLADGTIWKWEYSRIGLFGLVGNMLGGLIIGVMIAVPVIILIWLIIAIVAVFRVFRGVGHTSP